LLTALAEKSDSPKNVRESVKEALQKIQRE
jgi:hypothetical protein